MSGFNSTLQPVLAPVCPNLQESTAPPIASSHDPHDNQQTQYPSTENDGER